jgi:nucleoid DNA-binding protein
MPNNTPAPAAKNKPKAKKAMNKTQLKAKLAEETGLAPKDVVLVLDALNNVAVSELNATGVFTIHGLLKLTKAVKKATPEKQGINPLTKQPMTIKAKPAKNVVRLRALKSLKDAVS